MDTIGQVVIDVMTYFLGGFGIMLVISWLVSLFPGRRDF